MFCGVLHSCRQLKPSRVSWGSAVIRPTTWTTRPVYIGGYDLTVRLLALALALCGASCRHVQEDPRGQRQQEAYECLIKEGSFALGPVGMPRFPVISSGEQELRQILQSGDRAAKLEMLRAVILQGTNEAKLYALCGIHTLSWRSLRECAKPLLAANPMVSTLSGCVAGRARAADIIKLIRRGGFDAFLCGP